MSTATDTLSGFEAVITTSIKEYAQISCSQKECKHLPEMASAVAEEVIDAVSFDWAGQMLYFASTTRQKGSVNSGEEFLLAVEDALIAALQPSQMPSCCTECAKFPTSWDELIASVVVDFYEAHIGELLYVSFCRHRRDKLINKEFTGNNVPQLVRKYRVCSGGIYKILARCNKKIRTQ